MVVREYYNTRKDGVKLFRTYSDEGMYIVQVETNTKYTEAIDVENAPFTYIETNEPIEESEEETVE